MSKKTESIEVRLSPELKSALARVSCAKGTSMSDTVRTLIEGEVNGRVQTTSQDTGEPSMVTQTTALAARIAAFALPVTVLAAIYVVSAQSSATANPEIRAFFTQVDVNADRRISLAEVERFLQAGQWRPETACADIDGPCTVTAFAAFQLDRADTDRSGALSYAEFAAVNYRDWAEDFLAMDVDGNGVADRAEILRFTLLREVDPPSGATDGDRAAFGDACLLALEEDIHGALPDACGANIQALAAADSIVAAYDADHSGTVTLSEYLGH
ncbi:calcium-binding EF-hand domain-containing protein [Jannaschia sp. CCS1]|uniref:calcium-binding EF-hand domain-containing protein n=1 Tax=Jannaschia sp. (strain CCS1) TaxID=290400 RepID=UPI000053AD21|nr:calcium-binding EF-hand domain-containing protein [Jannaschia sp. CCS1]ABD54829.1 Calcium-binding EF-hand [Jannaschia sp. CCS1]